MKTFKFFAICAIAAMALTMVSCNRASAPRTNLRTTVDTTSYAWGVALAPNLVQILEHQGILENVSMMEQYFDFRMMAADSLGRIALGRERRAAVDSINRLNEPRLNEFIRGMRQGINNAPDADSPHAFGVTMGTQLAQMIAGTSEAMFGPDSEESLNTNQLLAGLIKSLRGQQTVMSTEEAGEIFQRNMERAQEEQMMNQFGENREAGIVFLTENARRPEVTVLPSGLQYEIIREGTGEKPGLHDRVRVHYHGTLIDGTVFDSSMDRQRENPDRDWAAVFPVGGVISGWTEALQLMPVGSKWKLFIPYDLAYGAQDRGIIGPFSVLVFEVELIGIE